MSRRTSNAREEKLDAIFSALGDSTRRKILARLARGDATITELAEPFAMSLPAVSKHLRVLENARLVSRRREGWYHHCHIEARPLEEATAFLARYRPFWESTLDQLAKYVEEPNATGRGK